jgi:hypothetical protein
MAGASNFAALCLWRDNCWDSLLVLYRKDAEAGRLSEFNPHPRTVAMWQEQ